MNEHTYYIRNAQKTIMKSVSPIMIGDCVIESALKVHQLNTQRTKVKCFHSIICKFDFMRRFPTATKTSATPTFTTSAPETITKIFMLYEPGKK